MFGKKIVIFCVVAIWVGISPVFCGNFLRLEQNDMIDSVKATSLIEKSFSPSLIACTAACDRKADCKSVAYFKPLSKVECCYLYSDSVNEGVNTVQSQTTTIFYKYGSKLINYKCDADVECDSIKMNLMCQSGLCNIVSIPKTTTIPTTTVPIAAVRIAIVPTTSVPFATLPIATVPTTVLTSTTTTSNLATVLNPIVLNSAIVNSKQFNETCLEDSDCNTTALLACLFGQCRCANTSLLWSKAKNTCYTCGPPYTLLFSKYCYLMVSNADTNWVTAQTFCNNLNGKLAFAEDTTEEEAIRNFTGTAYIYTWIGAIDAFYNVTVKWITTSLPPGPINCIAITSISTITASCNNNYPFICKKFHV